MDAFEFTITDCEIAEFKKKRFARACVANAIRTGTVVRPSACHRCNREEAPLDAHHVDYGRPLDVMWLCRECHGIAHTSNSVLNPKNNLQTPINLPASRLQTVTVSFTMPVKNYLALRAEAKKLGKSPTQLLQQEAVKNHKTQDNQLEFNFEVKRDDSQDVRDERIQSVAPNEDLLPKSKGSVLQKVRGKRDLNLRGMEGGLFEVSRGYGNDARELHRCVASG